MKKVRGLIVIIAAIALLSLGFTGAKLLEKEPKVTVSATSIEERLSECSSLTTARLDYRGLIKYEEGEITFINKKGFSMVYDAQIKAGIDLAKAAVKVSGKKIKVTIPDPEIQDVSINPNTLEFYDEQYALFNWSNKEDTKKAMEYARDDARAKSEQTDILTQATEQAKTVIKTLMLPVAENTTQDYSIEVVQR